jgi:hypothetical protein
MQLFSKVGSESGQKLSGSATLILGYIKNTVSPDAAVLDEKSIGLYGKFSVKFPEIFAHS